MQWEIAARVLSLGVNVILEFGFWSRRERDDFRSRAAALGSETKLHFLDVPRDELLRRLELRNAALPPDTFHVDDADLVAAGQLEPGKSEVDGHAALFFLAQAVRVNAGERLYERGLSVVDVTCRSDYKH